MMISNIANILGQDKILLACCKTWSELKKQVPSQCWNSCEHYSGSHGEGVYQLDSQQGHDMVGYVFGQLWFPGLITYAATHGQSNATFNPDGNNTHHLMDSLSVALNESAHCVIHCKTSFDQSMKFLLSVLHFCSFLYVCRKPSTVESGTTHLLWIILPLMI